MGSPLIAQDTTKPVLTFSGFAEVYYSYDCNRPADHNRPGFIYSHNRHNEFAVNLAFIRAACNAERVRANLAFGAGTYINANYGAEPAVLKSLYEANAGIKLSKDHNLWFDMGIFASHIGFESAESKDCWNLTRSMLAENSPYYEAGAKISFITGNGKWLFSGLALNGWQRIQRLPGSSLMNWGSQVMFKPSGNLMINYSSFIGTDKPDSNRLWRYFHNLYGVLALNYKFGLTLGFDFGQEQVSRGGRKLNSWFSPVCIIRYASTHNWAISLRAEYFNDAKGVIILTGTQNGFKTYGCSLNVDKTIGRIFLGRAELRILSSKDNIFIKATGLTNNNTAITGSLVSKF
jgi:hypothetical protein